MDKIKQHFIDDNIVKYGKTLYHYTSINAFINILKTKQLWFGYTKNMNDRSEVVCFIDRMKQAISDDIPDCYKVKPYIIDKINSSEEKAHAYIMSFSILNEDAAQWDRYGDYGRGICIGFNTTALSKICLEFPFWMTSVYYDWNERNHELYKILIDYVNENKLSGFIDIEHIAENLSYCGLFHKHSAFSSEKEVRIIDIGHSETNKENIIFSCKNDQIKKYLIEDIDLLCSKTNITLNELIDSIIIGPRSNQNIEELKDYLADIGYDSLAIKVQLSNCPLR